MAEMTLVIPPQPSGRRLIRFKEGVSRDRAAALLGGVSGRPVIGAAEYGALGGAAAASRDEPIMLLDQFGVAAVGGGAEQAAALSARLLAEDDVVDSRPEFWMFAVSDPPWSDDAATTWGLDATGVPASPWTGKGVRLAVLDTGADLDHPDFIGRAIVTRSFVAGETVDDGHGHGTHTTGTAAIVRDPAKPGAGNIPRYGIAGGAELFVGKVLNDRGAGRELDIIAGIDWAIGQGCAIVSMSIGRSVGLQEQPDPLYDDIARRALAAGTLLICAAGNDSDRRYGYVAPVTAPANSPGFMAVAAIGADGLVGGFSCGGTGVGQIDLAAPGIGIFSSVPHPEFYKKMMGTSMACPHVAGIAALWAESDPQLRGQALRDKLIATVRPLPGSPQDIGAGLVQAPRPPI